MARNIFSTPSRACVYVDTFVYNYLYIYKFLIIILFLWNIYGNKKMHIFLNWNIFTLNALCPLNMSMSSFHLQRIVYFKEGCEIILSYLFIFFHFVGHSHLVISMLPLLKRLNPLQAILVWNSIQSYWLQILKTSWKNRIHERKNMFDTYVSWKKCGFVNVLCIQLCNFIWRDKYTYILQDMHTHVVICF